MENNSYQEMIIRYCTEQGICIPALIPDGNGNYIYSIDLTRLTKEQARYILNAE